MKRTLSLFLALGLGISITSSASAVVIIGGSTNNGNLDSTVATVIVDNPDPNESDFFLPKPQIWQNVGTRTISGPYEDEMSSEPWAGPAPTPVTTDNLLNLPFPNGCGDTTVDGDCGVFFKPFSGNATDGPATGHLQQDNTATPGLTYKLSGWAGAEANALMAGAEIALEFLDDGGGVIGGSVINLLPTLFVPNGQPFNYKLYSTSAVAPDGTLSVRARASMIGGLGNPAGGGQAFVVDDFTLEAVPEPTSLALGVSIIGLMGLVRRR